MGYENGQVGITHCPLCGIQFDEPQKFGDIVECEDGCQTRFNLIIKPKKETKEND